MRFYLILVVQTLLVRDSESFMNHESSQVFTVINASGKR